MKRIWILILLLCCVIPVSATTPLVNDHADLLTDSQEEELTRQLEDMQSLYGIDVVVLTETSLDGSSPMRYADDYYDNNGYADDGVLLLVDMGQRQWWISTCGSCISSVNVNAVGDRLVPYLKDGAYYDGFSVFADSVKTAIVNTDYDSPGIRTEEISYGKPWYTGLGKCLVIGIVVGGITVAAMAVGMRSVKPKHSASDYIKEGGVQLTCEQDRYLYQTVTKRAKPKNNSSSGSHSSSSGRSHGGGGGRF